MPKRPSENGYFSQSQRQTQIIILEILNGWMPVPLYLSGMVIIFVFLDLEKNISFPDHLIEEYKQTEVIGFFFKLRDHLLKNWLKTGENW